MTKVAQFRPFGISADIPPEKVPPELWTSADNVLFRDELTVRSPGYLRSWGTLLDAPEHLTYSPSGPTNYWCYAGANTLSVTDGTSHFDITPTSWVNPIVSPNTITSATLNTLPVFTKGIDPPVYWDLNTGTAAQDLPDWPTGTACRVLRAFKFYLIAMNIKGPSGDNTQQINWSDAAAPGQIPQSWTPGTGSDAGDNVIAEPTGPILDGLGLRDDFIIYKANSTHLMQFVGGDAVFSFRTLFTKSGILAPNCVVEVRGVHYVLTDSDIIAHDGQTLRSIIDENLRVTLFQLLDPDNFRISHVVFNEESNELLFCVPAVGSTRCNVALVYSFEDDVWGLRDLPDTAHAAQGLNPGAEVLINGIWDDDTQAWDLDGTKWNQESLATSSTATLIASPTNTRVYELDADNTADGEIISARVARESLDLGSPNIVKMVKRIWPKIDADPGVVVSIRVGGQLDVNGGIAFDPAVEFTVGSDISADFTTMGKFITVEFSSEIVQEWRLSGFEIEYTEAGRF